MGVTKILPHGSGIDSTWDMSLHRDSIRFKNSFHCMNDHGYYEGWQDFSLVCPKSDLSQFQLVFHGSQYLAQKHDLRPYLEDLFSNFFETLKPVGSHADSFFSGYEVYAFDEDYVFFAFVNSGAKIFKINPLKYAESKKDHYFRDANRFLYLSEFMRCS